MKQKLFNVFFYLFFFFMINREFNPFGLDLRIIGVIIALVLIIMQLKDCILKKEEIILEKKDILIPLFFLVCFISNISWFFNDLDLYLEKFLIILVSYLGNLLFYLVFRLYKDYINIEKFKNAIKISVLVLIMSMLLTMFGVNIRVFLMAGCDGYVKDLATNFLGGTYRYAGYAQDPNYASLFLVFGLATEIYMSKIKKLKLDYLYFFMIVFCFLLSASKTTLIALFPALILSLFKKCKLKQIANVMLIPVVIIVPIILVVLDINLFGTLTTMTQRLQMWEFALELFKQNPIIGSGLTSVRSYIEVSGWWYVQCHSTIFQMLSETGIISLVIFCIILTKVLLRNNKFLTFITCLFSVYMITTETVYHVYFIFVLAILPLIIKEEKMKNNKKKKVTVFVVNSLSNGGAERVVANLANKMDELGKKVYIYILNNKVTYPVNKTVNVISLYNGEIKGIRKAFMIPYLSRKLTKELRKLENDYEIELYTSHLKFSNYVSRFSKYTKKCIYVMHIPFSPYGSGYFYEKKIKFIYNNQNIMTVSNGVEKEILVKYNMKVKNIATIYNPIDVKEISKKSKEKVELPCDKYILLCGRLNYQKRPMMAIDIFYKTKLYKKYNLVLLGQGELEEEVKEKIKEYKIEDKVHLLGWCKNPYAYMRNSLLLMNCSSFEAFPMTMIEAFACECKVVSFDINYGPNEILTDELEQFLVKDTDIVEMGTKINLAIEKYPKGLRKRVEQYQTENIVNNYYEISKKWSKNED